MNMNWEAIPNCGSIKSKTVTKLFYRVMRGMREFRNHTDIGTFMTSMSGIVTTPIRLKVGTKIFGKPSLKELVNKCSSLKNRELIN